MVELMIYHGDPMVGIPLLVDQPGNIAHIKARKAAVRLNLNTMSSTDLLNTLKWVINDSSRVQFFLLDTISREMLIWRSGEQKWVLTWTQLWVRSAQCFEDSHQ